jgi:hypothetical protein
MSAVCRLEACWPGTVGPRFRGLFSFGIQMKFQRLACLVATTLLSACELEPFGEPPRVPPPVPCATTADCCAQSPSSICASSSGTCEPNPFCAQDPNCFGSRFGQCSGTGPTPTDPTHPTDPSPGCRAFPVGSATFGPPAFFCGAPGPTTNAVMSDLNLFWQSSMVACACDGLDSLGAGCQNNAMVMPATPGYIYYDRNMLAQLTQATGLGLSAAWFMAHEAGHNVQLVLNMPVSSGKARELSADCLAGYFVAWLVCTGRVPWEYSNAAFTTACQVGDPFASPWFSHHAHGTCSERQTAVSQGTTAYQRGLAPWTACLF